MWTIATDFANATGRIRAITKVEKELAALEDERSGIMKLFTQDPVKFDLERTKRLKTLETMIQHTEAEWARLTEQLASMETKNPAG